jgi:hypothetical protein
MTAHRCAVMVNSVPRIAKTPGPAVDRGNAEEAAPEGGLSWHCVPDVNQMGDSVRKADLKNNHVSFDEAVGRYRSFMRKIVDARRVVSSAQEKRDIADDG